MGWWSMGCGRSGNKWRRGGVLNYKTGDRFAKTHHPELLVVRGALALLHFSVAHEPATGNAGRE
jgi:hypothetical protein